MAACVPAHDHGQRGVLAPAFAVVLALAVLASALVVGVANRATERAAAQAVADAVALAGAGAGPSAAEQIAAANNGSISFYSEEAGVVTVGLLVDGIAAVAAAEKQIRPAP